MQTFFRVFTALAAVALLLAPPAATAQDAKKTAAAAQAKGKDLYPQAFFDFMLQQRVSQKQPDTPELRAAIRDELNTRELLVREAKKKGLDKAPGMKAEMDLTAQRNELSPQPLPDRRLLRDAGRRRKNERGRTTAALSRRRRGN